MATTQELFEKAVFLCRKIEEKMHQDKNYFWTGDYGELYLEDIYGSGFVRWQKTSKTMTGHNYCVYPQAGQPVKHINPASHQELQAFLKACDRDF